MKDQQLSPLAQRAYAQLKHNGRVTTHDNISRLAMIELKAFGLAEDPRDDIWNLTPLAARIKS